MWGTQQLRSLTVCRGLPACGARGGCLAWLHDPILLPVTQGLAAAAAAQVACPLGSCRTWVPCRQPSPCPALPRLLHRLPAFTAWLARSELELGQLLTSQHMPPDPLLSGRPPSTNPLTLCHLATASVQRCPQRHTTSVESHGTSTTHSTHLSQGPALCCPWMSCAVHPVRPAGIFLISGL